MYLDFDPLEKLLELEANLVMQGNQLSNLGRQVGELQRIVKRQTEYNNHVGSALEKLYNLILIQEQEIKELKNEKTSSAIEGPESTRGLRD